MGIRRSGIDGQLTVGKQEIELTLNLGMLMSAFKGVIESEITTFIDEHIY
jgi:putative polyhydroxyalkanoate system protein